METQAMREREETSQAWTQSGTFPSQARERIVDHSENIPFLDKTQPAKVWMQTHACVVRVER